jgi:hypothetical protein
MISLTEKQEKEIEAYFDIMVGKIFSQKDIEQIVRDNWDSWCLPPSIFI